MPRPPGIIDRVNWIIDFVQDPCEAPWQVYLQTALPPAGELILTWFDFGLDDVLRGFLRPKGLRSFGHLRGRRRIPKNRRRPAFVNSLTEILEDDLGNIIGKHLPGARIVKARRVSDLEKTLWIIDQTVQRVLFYWLVIDVVTEFLYDWTSLLMETQYCQNQANIAFYAEWDEMLIPPNLALTILGPDRILKNRGGIFYGGNPPGWNLPSGANISFSGEVSPTQTYPGTAHIEIRDAFTGERFDRSSTPDPNTGKREMIAGTFVKAGRYVGLVVNEGEEYARVTNIKMSVIGM